MKKWLKKIIFGLLIILIVFLMIYEGIIKNAETFWNFTIGNGLTLLVALIVTYYFTQQNLDERNRKELYLKQLEKLQLMVADEVLFKISQETDINRVLMKKRKINNCMTVLNKYAKEFRLEKEMQFISDKVEEYSNLIGEHQEDKDYLSKSEIELARPLDLIEQKVNEMKMKIFE